MDFSWNRALNILMVIFRFALHNLNVVPFLIYINGSKYKWVVNVSHEAKEFSPRYSDMASHIAIPISLYHIPMSYYGVQ